MHDLICIICNDGFKSKNKNKKTCSKICLSEHYSIINKKIGGDRSSLDYHIIKYGKHIGELKYNDKNKKISNTNKGMVSHMKGKKHSNKTKKLIQKNTKTSEYHSNIRGKTYNQIRGEGASEKLSKKMKGVFTLKWFIEKYGKIDGIELYNNRNANIAKTTHFREFNKKNRENFSKISQKLFWDIYIKIKHNFKKIYFAELNHEYSCHTGYHNYDFVILDNKKVIEFNGDKFHANPQLYNENDVPLSFMQLNSKEIWERDIIKNELLLKNGYSLKIIWENDYKNNPDNTLNECLSFLKN